MSAGLTDSSPTVDALDADNTPLNDAAAASTGSRQFTKANSEYVSTNDLAALSHGDVDFSYSAWFYLDTAASTYMEILVKWVGTDDNREHTLYTNNSKFYWDVSTDGGSGGSVKRVINGTVLVVGKWYHVYLEHDAANNHIGISVNDNTMVTTANTDGVHDGTAPFKFSTSGSSYDGRMAKVGFWKRVLTTAERTEMVNSGAGRAYSDLTTAHKVSLTAYWNLDEASGNAIDSHVGDGSLDLTDNNSVTAAGGLTTATPFSVHVRAQCTTKPGSGVSEAVWEFGQTTGANNNVRIAFRNQGGTFLIRAVDADAGAAATIDSSAISASTWYSILFVKRSASDRQLYVNTTSAGTDTSTVSSAAMQRLRLFASPADLATRSSDNVYLSSMGVWDFDISADSDAMRRLNIGQSETSVRPDQLAAAWDFVSQPSAVYERDQIYDMNDPGSAEEPAYSPTVEPNRFYPPRRGRWDYSRKPGRLNGRAIA